MSIKSWWLTILFKSSIFMLNLYLVLLFIIESGGVESSNYYCWAVRVSLHYLAFAFCVMILVLSLCMGHFSCLLSVSGFFLLDILDNILFWLLELPPSGTCSYLLVCFSVSVWSISRLDPSRHVPGVLSVFVAPLQELQPGLSQQSPWEDGGFDRLDRDCFFSWPKPGVKLHKLMGDCFIAFNDALRKQIASQRNSIKFRLLWRNGF